MLGVIVGYTGKKRKERKSKEKSKKKQSSKKRKGEKKTTDATDGPRPVGEPVPIWVNGRASKKRSYNGNKRQGEEEPVIHRKDTMLESWERNRGFFSHQKQKKGRAQWGISGVRKIRT